MNKIQKRKKKLLKISEILGLKIISCRFFSMEDEICDSESEKLYSIKFLNEKKVDSFHRRES